jgi:dienelactone hydrolase
MSQSHNENVEADLLSSLLVLPVPTTRGNVLHRLKSMLRLIAMKHRSFVCVLMMIAGLTSVDPFSVLLSEQAASDETGMARALEPTLVEFPGPEGRNLHGYLYKPAGEGPFPAMIWNHGSEQYPGQQSQLAEFYVNNGFVFFLPHRSGQGKSSDAGEYIRDTIKRCTGGDCIVAQHENANLNVVKAVEWLKRQSFVKADEIVMSGLSFGGIQTLLAAEKGLGIRAFASFAPAAMSWVGVPLLHDRLLKAERSAKAPIFLIQARGDYNLGPSEVLGEYLKRKGGLNRAKLYPQFGPTPMDNHGGFATKVEGIRIWGDDVLAFLREALHRKE